MNRTILTSSHVPGAERALRQLMFAQHARLCVRSWSTMRGHSRCRGRVRIWARRSTLIPPSAATKPGGEARGSYPRTREGRWWQGGHDARMSRSTQPAPSRPFPLSCPPAWAPGSLTLRAGRVWTRSRRALWSGSKHRKVDNDCPERLGAPGFFLSHPAACRSSGADTSEGGCGTRTTAPQRHPRPNPTLSDKEGLRV